VECVTEKPATKPPVGGYRVIINESVANLLWRGRTSKRPKYELSDFALAEYSDPVVPVQILMVMMGFAIILLNNLSELSMDKLVNNVALVSGVLYLIAFMFYLTEYYEKLWEPYFLLPEDKLFFRMYSVLVGIVVIVLMSKWPVYWSAYVVFLFYVLYLKKRKTRNLFHKAVDLKFGSYSSCDAGKIKCQYVLVDTFTRNFLHLGILALFPFMIVMCACGLLINDAGMFAKFNGLWTYPFSMSEIRAIFIATSVITTTVTLVFWFAKITSGLREMRAQIEEGHYAYFEARDLRSRFRRGRDAY
jgi:hypothetical protein